MNGARRLSSVIVHMAQPTAKPFRCHEHGILEQPYLSLTDKKQGVCCRCLTRSTTETQVWVASAFVCSLWREGDVSSRDNEQASSKKRRTSGRCALFDETATKHRTGRHAAKRHQLHRIHVLLFALHDCTTYRTS